MCGSNIGPGYAPPLITLEAQAPMNGIDNATDMPMRKPVPDKASFGSE